MKQLQKSDLKEGEIYKQLDFNYIFLYNKNETSNNFNDGTAISTTRPRYYKRWTANGFKKDMIEATLEEKHWLETCIIANDFISFEEAMKTFIPEYVKCIDWKSHLNNPSHIEGVVYKILDGGFVELNPKYNGGLPTRYLKYKEYFKPSTKEAYDAQFVAKEPEFVLPEKWCVEVNDEIRDRFDYFKSDGYHHSIQINDTNKWSYIIKEGFTEITFEQFKKYVLKEDVKVLEESKDKVLSHFIQSGKTTIHSVECFEGGIYRISDKITPFDKDSPNKGKSFTIIGFRWNNAKTDICAITDTHQPYGIRLSQIELYIEPKVKVKDDFVLPEKWCIKNTDPLIYRFFDSRLRYMNQCYNNPIYENNYLHSIDFRGNNVINSQIGANIAYNYVKPNYTEITLEQFKKYVLKNE